MKQQRSETRKNPRHLIVAASLAAAAAIVLAIVPPAQAAVSEGLSGLAKETGPVAEIDIGGKSPVRTAKWFRLSRADARIRPRTYRSGSRYNTRSASPHYRRRDSQRYQRTYDQRYGPRSSKTRRMRSR